MAACRDGPPAVSEAATQRTSQHVSPPRVVSPAHSSSKRPSLLKAKPVGAGGYDFSKSFEQTRRVRFNFGTGASHSLAVEATLAKLFESLTMECSGVLVQPQWKHFRHLDMLKNDQIRLSNGIWRSWHIKYQKGRKPLFCTFKLNTTLNDHTRPEAVVLEGKYQKRKVEAVAREYRRWRLHHREKFRQGGCKTDPILVDLLKNAHGDELGGGNTTQPQAMQVDPPMPEFFQLDEISDSFLMSLGQEYYSEYSPSSNMMLQPKMDGVLSSSLDELLDRLEPMEVLLNRTVGSAYQSPFTLTSSTPPTAAATPTFPPSPTPPPPPQHHSQSPLQQQLISPQMTTSLSSGNLHHSQITPTPTPMVAPTPLADIVGEATNSLFSPFSPTPPPQPTHPPSHPSQAYMGVPTSQQSQPAVSFQVYDDSNDVTPTRTPPPQQQPSPFHFPIKRDPSSESLQSQGGNFMSPPGVGQPPVHIPPSSPIGRSNYDPSNVMMSQSSYGNIMFSSSGQPMSGVAMDTQQVKDPRLSLLSQLLPGETPPTVSPLQPSLVGGASVSMTTPTAAAAVGQLPYRTFSGMAGDGGERVRDRDGGGGGGGGVGSKRREGMYQFSEGAPGSKRRSPFNSQKDLPLWGSMQADVGTFAEASPMPPPSALPTTRRASIGSSAQLSERPVLEKNTSEPVGSLRLKEHVKMLSQQQEQHQQELDKQQSAAQHQYIEVLRQYKMQMPQGQEQVTEADQKLLQAVLSKPVLVDILRALLLSVPPSSASTSPSFSQPTPSPLLHTPSPTPLPPLSLPTSGSEREQPSHMQTEGLPSPTDMAKVTEFQSRLLVAAAVQASVGSHTHSSVATLTPSTSNTSFTSELDMSPLSNAIQLFEASKMKMKNTRGMSSEEKEVYKEIRRQSHISAEQKRRGTIKQGFEQLQSLVIDPSSYPSGKVSKAAVLEKTVEYIQHAHQERDSRERQMQALRREQEELNTAIASCQESLPASGVPVTRQRFEDNRRRFQEYVQRRTLQNYKFWIYSIILQQLFDSYNSTVSTGNQDELCRTVLAWFEQNCSLHALRPVVMNSLKELSTKTSILSEPAQVPQQLVQYARQQLQASHDFVS